MSTTRTIDDLGVETSSRYAYDVEAFDRSIIEEARGIPLHAQVDITTPFFTSHSDFLLGLRARNLPFPDFYPPKEYNLQRRRIFTHQLLPSLGSDEMLTTHIERIVSAVEKDKERKRGKGWEEEIDQEEEEKESETLIRFLEVVKVLDKIVTDITAGRNQYQKG